MTDKVVPKPKVFVSYSRTSPDHENRVRAWSERLASDGIEVLLDQWSLEVGQDKYAFMEKMVVDETVSKVLVFSDQRYANKADQREGGVGTESQIISSEMYEKVDQKKFIPIVCEKNARGEACLPVFLKNRIYVDFSTPEAANENYEHLVRLIFDKPLRKKPDVGKPPGYILRDSAPPNWLRPILENFKAALGKPVAGGYAATFLETLYERLEDFRVTHKDGAFLDEEVLASIETFKPFRDVFVEFVDSVLKFCGGDNEMFERVVEFFEKILYYRFWPRGAPSWGDIWADNYRFILYELFVYAVALLLKRRRFPELSMLTDKRYHLPSNSDETEDPFSNFGIFESHCQSLAQRNQRLNQTRLDPVADLMNQRASLATVRFDDILQAEAFLFVKSMVSPHARRPWYPHIFVYARYNRTVEFFSRARSHVEFEIVRKLLGVDSKEDLIQKYEKKLDQIGGWFGYRDVNLDRLLSLKKLDSLP